MIKRRALRASAFHFLFHAEGRVTPGQRGRLAFANRSERLASLAWSIDFLGFLWQDGRVTPGWAAAIWLGRWTGAWASARDLRFADGDDEVRRLRSLRTAFEGSHHPNRAARS